MTQSRQLSLLADSVLLSKNLNARWSSARTAGPRLREAFALVFYWRGPIHQQSSSTSEILWIRFILSIRVYLRASAFSSLLIG